MGTTHAIQPERASDLKLTKHYKLSQRQFTTAANGLTDDLVACHAPGRLRKHRSMNGSRTTLCLHDIPEGQVVDGLTVARGVQAEPCPTCHLIEKRVASVLVKRKEVAA